MPLGDGRFRVTRVEHGSMSSPVPAFDPSWSPLGQLRFHAALAELDAGGRVSITVEAADGWHRTKRKGTDYWYSFHDIYAINVPGHGLSPMDFATAWSYINALGVGISSGLRAAEKLAALRIPDPDEETPIYDLILAGSPIYDRLLAERA